jgi:glycosyltransferase involved in cell wall biosynthesis
MCYLNPKISVLIPAYNEEALIGKVVDSVHRGFESISWNSYEIIVCDNNSSDETSSIAKRHNAKVVYEPQNQIAKARNAAAKYAQGEWFIFLDADTFVTGCLLKETIQHFQSGKVIGGGTVLKLDTNDIPFIVRVLLPFWNQFSVFTGFAPGSYLFCYRDSWKEVGGFNEDYFAGEELFFSLKLRQLAKRSNMKMKVISNEPATTSARKIKWHGPWKMIWKMLWLNFPGALKNKEKCHLWYTRPDAKTVKR